MINNIFLMVYCNNNLGDDLFIRLTCQRYPSITFHLIVDEGKETGLRDISNLHIVQRTKIVRVLNRLSSFLVKRNLITEYIARKCDAAVILGGSIFIEGEHAWEKALIKQKKVLQCTKSGAVMGANFGPFYTERFYELYHNFFAQMEDVCFRDCWSFEQFPDLKQVRYAPDLVLTLDTSRFVQRKTKRMTIIPILLENRPELQQYEVQYTESLVSLVKQAIDDGWEVILQSFCKEQGDEKEINRILDNLDMEIRSKVLCSFYNANIDEMLKIIAGSDVVVSTRFHGMILGWMFNAKVYPIVYSSKMKNYLTDTQYQGFYSTVEKLQSITLEDVTNEENRVDITKLKMLAEEQFKWLNQQILDKD